MSNNNNLPATAESKERGKVTYQVAGQDVTLSYNIVRNFLTKGNGDVTDQDLTQFISICKYNQLNPFLGEAYLVKYGTSPAQMITSKEALMKRAEANENYDGMQGGVIVLRDGKVEELEGCFKLPEDKLLGGWAMVYRKDRKYPYVSRVTLDEYDKKQSTWNEKKSTMITKVAKVQALREAFPAQLGAMYTAEERDITDVEYVDVSDKVDAEIATNANAGGTLDFDQPKNEAKPKPEAPKDQPAKDAKNEKEPGF